MTHSSEEPDFLGRSVSSAGDINGDGMDDVIIGAPVAYVEPDYAPVRGETYVVSGSATRALNGTLNVSRLNGRNGFRIQGAQRYDASGSSVSSARDINGDGFDDLIVGAPAGDRNRDLGFAEDYYAGEAGESFVVFGGTNAGSGGVLDSLTLNGSDGFTILGRTEQVRSGASVSGAGDINGDGVDDLIIGGTVGRSSRGNDADNPRFSGESYVVFGSAQVGSSGFFDLGSSFLDGSNGFVLIGSENMNETVSSVSGAGDVNGDGVADVIIGASDPDSSSSETRLSYVVSGSANVGSSGLVEVASLDGSNGFVMDGSVSNGRFITSVSGAGDFNSDGVDDLIVGVPGAAGNGVAGSSYVVFGVAGTPVTPPFDLSQCTIIGTNGPDVLRGTAGPDVIYGLGGDDDIRSFGGADIIYAGNGNDIVNAGGGADRVFGEQGQDRLAGGLGNDSIDGGDQLFGGSGNDVLTGGFGADRLFGSSGYGLCV